MNQTLKTILWIIGLVLLGMALWYLRSLVIYVLVAAVISFMGAPVVRFLKRIKIGSWRVPSWLAAALTLFGFVILIALFFRLFAPLIADQAKVINQLDARQQSLKLEGGFAEADAWLGQFNLSGDARSNQQYIFEEIKSIINFSQVSKVFNNFFGIIGSAFAAVFSIFFMAFFFLKDSTLLIRFIMTLTPDKHMEHVKQIIETSGDLLTRYFVGILGQIAITTTIVSVGLSIVGIENALIIGFLAGIFNLIPYVGPIIGALLGLLIAVTTNFALGPDATEITTLVAGVVVVFAIAQLVDNFFTQPIVLGNSVKAHPLEIFLVISIAATVAGIAGMILAIPVYTILRVIAKEFLSKFKIVESLTRDI